MEAHLTVHLKTANTVRPSQHVASFDVTEPSHMFSAFTTRCIYSTRILFDWFEPGIASAFGAKARRGVPQRQEPRRHPLIPLIHNIQSVLPADNLLRTLAAMSALSIRRRQQLSLRPVRHGRLSSITATANG